jgi:O-antigen/teichoic acid export membrane protein
MATGHTIAAAASTAAASVLTLGLVGVAAAFHLGPIVFIACPYLGQIAVAGATSLLAARLVGISVSDLLRAVVNRRVKGAKIGAEARPAFAMWIMLPIAYQTDRLILSHLSTAEQLASYNVAVQFYNAALSIVATGASTMWGFFARARQASDLPTSSEFVRLTTAFALLGLTLAIAYSVGLPKGVSLISGGKIGVSLGVVLGFSALLICQSFHYPSAMLQTDPRGLLFNAYATGAMTIINVALGVLLTPSLGATGPVLASVVALTVALSLPSFLRAKTVLSRNAYPGRPSTVDMTRTPTTL